jgi:hypothetical protein
MIYRRRLVGDLATLDQMRDVVVLLDPFARLGDDRVKPTSELSILDILDFARQLYSTVSNFQR